MLSSERLPFDLSTLQVFLAVCEMKTTAAAARLLDLTQPAVSQIIIDAEKRLGSKLFDRKIRPMALTPAGIILQQRASALIAEARQIVPLLKKSRQGYLALVRVGLVDSLVRALSVPVVDTLERAASHVIVYSGLTSAHASALITRQLDLFIGSDDTTDVSGLERRIILDEPYVIITPPAGAQLELAQLARDTPFIRYSARSKTGADIERYMRRMGLEPARGVEFDDPHGVSTMVAAGRGWALTTPLCLMEAEVPLQSLGVRPLANPELRRTLAVISRQGEIGPAARDVCATAIAVLRKQCRLHFEQYPWLYDALTFGKQRGSAAASD